MKLLLAVLLLAAVVQGAYATSDSRTDTKFLIWVDSMGNDQPNGSITVQATASHGSFTCSAAPGEMWSHRYEYLVTNNGSSNVPLGSQSFFAQLRVPNCSNARFCAELPQVVSGSGGNPADWTVSQGLFPDGMAPNPIIWTLQIGKDAAVSGIPAGSTWRFLVFSNREPVRSSVVLNASHCFVQMGEMTCPQATAPMLLPSPCGAPAPPPPPPPPPPPTCMPKNFFVAQVYPALGPAVSPTQQATLQMIMGDPFQFGCFTGGMTVPFETLNPPHCTTVPGVLCLATNPQTHLLNLNAFIDPACCASPVVQFVRLTKMIPGSRKCPDTFPPKTFIQGSRLTMTGALDLREIRTWWPLMYSMPGTKFTLDIQGVCLSGTRTGMTFTDRWCWTVVANPLTFRLLIDWLHTSEIDMMEVPCIVGEDTYLLLVACANQLAASVQMLQMAVTPTARWKALEAAQNVLFNCEALVFCGAFMADVVSQQFPFDYNNLLPPGVEADGPPPNLSQPTPLGMPNQCGTIGILDTFENPCACKLITDLESIGTVFGISTPLEGP